MPHAQPVNNVPALPNTNSEITIKENVSAQIADDLNFDLMEILNEFNDNADEDQMVLVATQVEMQQQNSTMKAAMYRKNHAPTSSVTPMFNNCKFGSIGTINIVC